MGIESESAKDVQASFNQSSPADNPWTRSAAEIYQPPVLIADRGTNSASGGSSVQDGSVKQSQTDSKDPCLKTDLLNNVSPASDEHKPQQKLPTTAETNSLPSADSKKGVESPKNQPMIIPDAESHDSSFTTKGAQQPCDNDEKGQGNTKATEEQHPQTGKPHEVSPHKTPVSAETDKQPCDTTGNSPGKGKPNEEHHPQAGKPHEVSPHKTPVSAETNQQPCDTTETGPERNKPGETDHKKPTEHKPEAHKPHQTKPTGTEVTTPVSQPVPITEGTTPVVNAGPKSTSPAMSGNEVNTSSSGTTSGVEQTGSKRTEQSASQSNTNSNAAETAKIQQQTVKAQSQSSSEVPARQHVSAPGVPLPRDNFFDTTPLPKPEIQQISTPNPVQPDQQTMQVKETPPPKPPEYTPPGVFTGQGSGGEKVIVTQVPKNDKATQWLDIPSIDLHRVKVEPVTSARDSHRKVPASVDPGDVVAPIDRGSVGEDLHKIPGKIVDVAHGQLDDRTDGPFGHLANVKPGDQITRHGPHGDVVYKVTQIDTVKRDDHEALKKAYSPVTPGNADEWVGITCARPEKKDSHGLSEYRTIVRAVRADGRSTQDNGSIESKFGERPTDKGTSVVPDNTSSVVKVPPTEPRLNADSLSIGVSGKPGETPQVTTTLSTKGVDFTVTQDGSFGVSGDIPVIDTERDRLIVTPAFEVNAGTSDSGAFSPVVGSGPSYDLSATYAHKLSDNGTAVFARIGGSHQPDGQYPYQEFAQGGIQWPISQNLTLTAGVSTQGGSHKSNGPILDTTIGPAANLNYRVNDHLNLNVSGEKAGNNKTDVEFGAQYSIGL